MHDIVATKEYMYCGHKRRGGQTSQSLTLPRGGGGGGGGHSLVSSVPMRDQRIVEHTLNSVIDI